MNWEAIGAIGELVGAVTVLATLVYLAIQIKQNTKSVQIAASNSLMESAQSAVLGAASSAENSHVIHRGMVDYDSLNEKEASQYRLFIISQFNASDLLYWHYRQGTLEKELWNRQEKWMISYLNHPQGLNIWDAHKIHLTGAFCKFIDDSIRDKKVSIELESYTKMNDPNYMGSKDKHSAI